MYFLVKRNVKNVSIVWLIKYYYLQPFLIESKTKMRHQMSCVVKKKNKQTNNKMNFWALHVLSQRPTPIKATDWFLKIFITFVHCNSHSSDSRDEYACYSIQGCSYILVYFSLRTSSPIIANEASCARTSERHKPSPLVCGSRVTFRDKWTVCSQAKFINENAIEAIIESLRCKLYEVY